MDQQALTGRLRQALLAFETARQVFMRAQGRLNGLPMKKIAAYWRGPGQGIEQRMRSAAAAVVAAHRTCLVAGLSADAKDQHVIAEARRHSEGG
jgi:hypothetical protein